MSYPTKCQLVTGSTKIRHAFRHICYMPDGELRSDSLALTANSIAAQPRQLN
jgi:hypothetical protein